MNAIFEALLADQQPKVVQNQSNRPPLPPIPQQPTQPIIFPNGNDSGGGRDNPPSQNNMTPAEQYAQAIAVNQSPITAMPVVGMPIGMMNNAFIQSYEKKNPDKASKDPNRMYKSIFEQVMDSLMGRSPSGMFGVDNAGAFPNTQNFNGGNGYGDTFSDGPNADIGSSINTTDQSPSVGIGNRGTAVA